jgi:histidine triad (HIT) family protein
MQRVIKNYYEASKIVGMDSVFTRIIKGEIPCHKVYEDDRVIAFLDIHPQQPGHVLVVPKQQIDLIWDLPAETYDYLWQTAKKIALHMGPIMGKRIGVHVEGIGVPHAHIHLVPFTNTDEFLRHPDMSAEPDHTALAQMAKKLAIAPHQPAD